MSPSFSKDHSQLTAQAGSCYSSIVPFSLKRRGHQHHTRLSGTRRFNVQPNVQDIFAALYKNGETKTISRQYNNTYDNAECIVFNKNLTTPALSCNSSTAPSCLKRRGHQHHPRFSGTRRPKTPPSVPEILAAFNKNNETKTTSKQNDNFDNQDTYFIDDVFTHCHIYEPEDNPITAQCIKASLNLPLAQSCSPSMTSNSPTPTDDSRILGEVVASAPVPLSVSLKLPEMPKEKKFKKNRATSDRLDANKDKKKEQSKKDKSPRSSTCLKSNESLNDTASATTDEGIAIDDEDIQTVEWEKFRCTSEAAEIVAERETRRNKNRCADYPGLAFGRSVFSSDTMMKFNIIQNELHNIMKTQLKRAESEVGGFNRRIQLLEEDLKCSEKRLGYAKIKLSEASQAVDESELIHKFLENHAIADERRLEFFENQLKHACFLADDADKKYDEMQTITNFKNFFITDASCFELTNNNDANQYPTITNNSNYIANIKSVHSDLIVLSPSKPLAPELAVDSLQ